jgi:hypothetical protein
MGGQSRSGGSIAGIVRGRRISGRAAGLVAMLILLVVGVAFVIVSFALRSPAARSSFVQAHGMRREAVILNVDNIAHTSTTTNGSSGHTVTSTTYTAEVLARLADPVGGQTRTTVHVPHYETADPGNTVTVLVDPDEPGYAELPGSPSTPAEVPTIFLAVGAFLTVVSVTGSALIARSWRRSPGWAWPFSGSPARRMIPGWCTSRPETSCGLQAPAQTPGDDLDPARGCSRRARLRWSQPACPILPEPAAGPQDLARCGSRTLAASGLSWSRSPPITRSAAARDRHHRQDDDPYAACRSGRSPSLW